MSKYEFLSKLREAICVELSSQEVEEHIRYYDQYITESVLNGRTEAEVLAELGDPWVIARTILGTGSTNTRAEYVYDSSDDGYERSRDTYNRNVKIYQMDTWWKKALILLGVLVVLGLIISFITGLIGLLAPIIFPVALILLLVKMFQKK